MSARTIRERVETVRGHKYISLKSGRRIGFWDAIAAVERAQTALATAFSRAFKLAGGDSDDLQTLEYRLDRVEEHTAALRAYLGKLRSERAAGERIARLRDTRGRTPEEAAAYLAKADALEAARGGRCS